MRKIILWVLFLQFWSAGSQTFCRTPHTSATPEMNTLLLKSQSYVPDSYCLRIYVHVIRRSDGTGGQTVGDVHEALGYLDMDFNPHNIYFDWDGHINYIDDDTQYGGTFLYGPFFNNPLNTDGIDIFMFDDSASWGGMAYGVGENAAFYVSGTFNEAPYDSLIKSRVISHEMGHVCFLYHTHRQKETFCQEFVDGSNSHVCGDFVLDTPPDPGMDFDVDYLTCQWNSSGNDPNGVPYDPDETLIMAYTNPTCMSYFSAGQGERMRNAIENLPHLKDAIVDCGNCPTGLNLIGNVAPGGSDDNHAYDYILASNVIGTTANAHYKAGEEIELNPGFYAESGSIFLAEIEPCAASSSAAKQATKQAGKQEITTELEPEGPENGLSVYPNPSQGNITVALSNFDAQIEYRAEIYNLFGQMVRSEALTAATSEIDLQDIESGIYIVRLYRGGQRVATSEKIVLY